MKKNKDNCTAMIVGRKATIDGSTIITRDEDGYGDINEEPFVIHEAKDYDEDYVPKYNGLKLHLKRHGYRWAATPTADASEGRWDEQGINEYNVAMPATETKATNAHCLGHDPLVKNNVDEDPMMCLILPLVKSAREGVARLDELIEKHGTGESNGIAFSDHDGVQYFETGANRQWVTQRIPEGSYAICPNIMVIQDIDLDDHENFIYALTIRDFVEKNRLNPSTDGKQSFRSIFGTKAEADSYYNTPRTWYSQGLFSPSVEQDPLSREMPFIRKPEKKIGVEDVEYFLSSRYSGTEYDPMGSFASGDDKEQKMFRSIVLDKNRSSCIFQIRNGVPKEMAAIQWVSFGFYAHSPYVPFYANTDDTPLNYQRASHIVTPESSAYQLYKSLQVLIEPGYHQLIYQVDNFRDECQSYAVSRVSAIDERTREMSGRERTKYSTAANAEAATRAAAETKELISDLTRQALNTFRFQSERDDNL